MRVTGLIIAIALAAISVEAAGIVMERDAGNFSESSDLVEVGTDSKISSQAVGLIGTDPWVKYDNVSFMDGTCDSLTIRYKMQSTTGGSKKVEIRLDAKGGTLVGSFVPEPVQYWSSGYRTETFALTSAKGMHDLFIVATGNYIDADGVYLGGWPKDRDNNFFLIDRFSISCPLNANPDDAKTYYVDIAKGSDDNDGLSVEKPFKTIGRAAGIMRPGSKCLIRQGVYRETVAPVFTGVSGSPLTFEAYQNEEVYINACEIVSGWSADNGKVHKAAMNWDMGRGLNQVFIDGKMLIEARCPNLPYNKRYLGDPFYTASQGCYANPVQDDGTTSVGLKGYTRFFYPDSVGRAQRAGSQYVPAIFSVEGVASCFGGTAVDFFKGANIFVHGPARAQTGIVTASTADGNGYSVSDPQWLWGQGFKWFSVSGIKNLLDSPAEWALENKTLYLWAPDGDNPGTHVIEAKSRELVFDLRAKSHIVLRELKFFGGAILMEEANNCRIEKCHSRYGAHYTLAGGSSIGASIWMSGNNNTIKQSSVRYSAGAGIRLRSGDGFRVNQCIITHCDYAANYAAGVSVGNTKNVTIDSCTFSHMGRSSIDMSGAGAGAPLKVLYNHSYYIGLFTGEKGHMYLYGPSFVKTGTEVAYNWFHDASGWGTGGIVHDGGGHARFTIHHNVFWIGGAYDDNHDECNICSHGEFNVIYNNTYIDSGHMWHWEYDGINQIDAEPTGGLDYWKLKDPNTQPFGEWDFRPQAGSPAIDAGVAEIPPAKKADGTITVDGTTITDFEGSAPDLGAYEYGGDNWKPGHTWGDITFDHIAVINGTSVKGIDRISRAGLSKTFALRVLPGRLFVFGATGKPLSVRIFNARGACVAEKSYKTAPRMASISTKMLGRGSCFVRIVNGKMVRTEKLLNLY
jgi:hypothetical protein